MKDEGRILSSDFFSVSLLCNKVKTDHLRREKRNAIILGQFRRKTEQLGTIINFSIKTGKIKFLFDKHSRYNELKVCSYLTTPI